MFLVRISIIDRDAWLSLSRLSVGSAYFLRSSIDVASPSFDQLFCGGSDLRWMNLLIALNVQIDNSIKCCGIQIRMDYKRPANRTLSEHRRLNMLLKY
jgi:hypothetical protein